MRIVKLTAESKKGLLEDLLQRSPNHYGQYESAVAEIIETVKKGGDEALFSYTEKFDHCKMDAAHIRVTREEIDEAYEKNTGVLIADYFKDKDYEAVPAVLCKNHGPFTWGKDAHEAVHNAVVLEEVAKMASRCELINPQVKPAPQELQDKHYYRKHGANAYYGQNN